VDRARSSGLRREGGEREGSAAPLKVILTALRPVDEREGKGSDAPLHQCYVLHVISGLIGDVM
jgi:hypothetical protein